MTRVAPLALLLCAVALITCGNGDRSEPPSPPPTGDCYAVARARAEASARAGTDPHVIRMELEADIVRCDDPNAPPSRALFIGRVNADLARAGASVVDGSLAAARYLDFVADRTGKLALFRADPSYRDAYARGDADGDLVPDDRDRCPGSPPSTATDREGCPLAVTDPACAPALVDCTARPRARVDEEAVRRAFERTTFMINPRCDTARPRAPSPIAWGRGTNASGEWGFNLMVSKVPIDGLAPGCELFYEVEVRFAAPNKAGLPPVKYVNVLFRASEDLHPTDAARAVFGAPVVGPPPGGRTELVTGFSYYLDVTWRVRAMTGNQIPSPWSDVRHQGPAPSGVF